MKIVLIEDNQDAASLLRRLLSELGHDVRVAFDGLAGVALTRRLRPDVVVSDLKLPGNLSGYQVALQPALRHGDVAGLFDRALGFGGDEKSRRGRRRRL